MPHPRSQVIVGLELDQEVNVAVGGIKSVAGCGAEYIQPADAILPAQAFNHRSVLLNYGKHSSPLRRL